MRSVYELTLALRVWLIGCIIVSVVSLSDLVFGLVSWEAVQK